jgi:DnaJ-class molecular chaperone
MPRSAAANPEDLLVPCPPCEGSGVLPPEPPEPARQCPTCRGLGRVSRRKAARWRARHQPQ